MTRSIPILVFALLASSCAYHSPAAPTPIGVQKASDAAALIQLSISSRTNQDDVTAVLTTSDGRYVAGVPVTFAIGAGTITPSSGVSDALGAVHAVATSSTTTMITATSGNISTAFSIQPTTQGTSSPTPSPTTPTPSPTPTPTTNVLLNVPAASTSGNSVSMFVSAAAGIGPWTWTFGDGQTQQTTAYSTTHIYTSAGTYAVTASSSSGLSVSGSIAIAAPPTPTPTPTPVQTATIECTLTTTLAVGCHVTLTDASGTSLTSQINLVRWDWGDGHPVEQTSLVVTTHSYQVAGTYTIAAAVYSGAIGANTSTSVKVQ